MTVTIYGLLDPRTSHCRYVGKTKGKPTARLRAHISDAKRFGRIGRFHWINKLSRLQLEPVLIELESVTVSEWQEAEQFWIANMRALGCNLLNATEGGDGVHGLKLSAESRAKQSAAAIAAAARPDVIEARSFALRAAYSSEEARKAISERLRISHSTPEVKAKLSAAAKAKAATPKFKEAMRRAHVGKIVSIETRKKLSKAMKGVSRTQQAIAKSANGHRGMIHSEETKEKMRATWAKKNALKAAHHGN